MQQKIEKSIKYCNSNSNSEYINVNNNNNISNEDFIIKENDKLSLYMKNLNFLNFNNSNNKENENMDNGNIKKKIFDKYPNLIDFQNLEKMTYNRIKISGNKFMGKRYDYKDGSY
jgi:hypothetical protein